MAAIEQSHSVGIGVEHIQDTVVDVRGDIPILCACVHVCVCMCCGCVCVWVWVCYHNSASG